MKNRTLVTVPFNPEWMDENGYMTKAWSALSDYPDADRLVGSISSPGDHVKVPEAALEGSRLDHTAIGGFVISKDRITHTFLYYKPRLDPNGLVHLGTVAIPAVAKIIPGIINVYHNIQESRGQAALLETWHLVAKCRADSVDLDHEWVMTERTANLVYPTSHLLQGKQTNLGTLPVNKVAMLKMLIHHLQQLAVQSNLISHLSADFNQLQRKTNHNSLNVVVSSKDRSWWYKWYLATKSLILNEGVGNELFSSDQLSPTQVNYIRKKLDGAHERIRQETL